MALRAQNAPRTESLPRLLGLDARQVERLDRLYDGFARTRLREEARIMEWQDELKLAQSPTSFDEREAIRLMRGIKNTE